MESSKIEKSTIVKDAIVLFLITLIGGLCLGYVYEITKEPIAEAARTAKQDSYKAVYVEATAFEEEEELKNAVKEAPGFLEEEGISGVVINEVLLAKDAEKNVIGYVLSVTSTEGYGGDIVLSLGISKDGTIMGIDTLSLSETAGLGAKASSDQFKSQFVGIQGEVVYTKLGKTADNEIDAISGATITTKAVTKAVNAGLSFVNALSAAE